MSYIPFYYDRFIVRVSSHGYIEMWSLEVPFIDEYRILKLYVHELNSKLQVLEDEDDLNYDLEDPIVKEIIDAFVETNKEHILLRLDEVKKTHQEKSENAE